LRAELQIGLVLSGWGDVAEVSIDLVVRDASSVLGRHAY
jgi:hypothetical protein